MTTDAIKHVFRLRVAAVDDGFAVTVSGGDGFDYLPDGVWRRDRWRAVFAALTTIVSRIPGSVVAGGIGFVLDDAAEGGAS